MNRILYFFLIVLFSVANLNTAQTQCEIWDVAATVHDCDGGFFSITLNFNFDEIGNDGFSVVGNGNNYGDFSYAELPVDIGPLEGDGLTEYEFVVIDNQFNDCQNWTAIDPVFCGVGDCGVFDLELVPGDCDGDGNYDLTINFEYVDPGNDFFEVIYEGDVIGFYALADLPITIEGFEDNGETVPAVSVCINDQPDCCDIAEFEAPNCGNCEIFDFEVINIDCVDDEFWITFNFGFNNVGSDGFNVHGNGTNYGDFPYSEVPFTLGPLPANGTFYEFVLNDIQHPDCADVIEYGVVDCGGGGSCEIWDLVLEAGDCNPATGTYNLWIDFNYTNPPSDFFDVIYDGDVIGFFELGDLPVVIENFEDNGEITPVIAVCINDTPDCCAEGEFESPCSSGGNCEIWDLVFETGDCDPATGTYNLWIDFNFANSPNDFFDVIYDGDVIGFFELDDLPIVIENFEDNGEITPAIAVCINDTPDCCAEGEFESPCASGGGCEIWDVFAEAHECDDDGNFMVDIEFNSNNTGAEGFSIVANGDEFGPFEYGEIFYTFGPLAGGGAIYEILVVDNQFNDCGGFFELGPIYCDDDCHIFDLVAEVTECDDDGQFYVILDFEYSGVGDEGFKVAGNGNVYGYYEYVDLPIEIGPFQTPIDDLEFIVTDEENPDCGDFIEVEAPNCDGSGDCEIWDLSVDASPCSSDGTFYAILNFEHNNTSEIAFSVQGNGISYGFFSYADLPISIGPLVGNGTTPYEFVVNDILMPDCGAGIDLGPVECDIMGDCQISDFVADASACNDDGTYDLWLNFDYANSPNIYFDVIYQGDIVAYFPLAELPVILPHFISDGEIMQEITVCINDTPDCCATTEYEAPDCMGPNLVWPGDTEASHLSNNFDLLNIGLAFGAEGPERSVQGIEWTELMAEQWPDNFANGLNFVHADCDGNGVVDEDDIQAIELNFGETHGDVIDPVLIGGNENDPPFFVDLLGAGAIVDGQQFTASIILGTEDYPIEDLYGIAFTLNFDPELIDPATVEIKYDPSWLGVENVNLITLDKTAAAEGQVLAALVRTDQNNVSGHGHVAEFIGIIDNIAGKEEVRITISDVKAITAEEVLVPLTRPEQVVGIVSSAFEPIQGAFKVYPNPANSRVSLTHPDGLNILSVKMRNVNGMNVDVDFSGNNQLDISDLSDGVYFMEIETQEATFLEKLVKL